MSVQIEVSMELKHELDKLRQLWGFHSYDAVIRKLLYYSERKAEEDRKTLREIGGLSSLFG